MKQGVVELFGVTLERSIHILSEVLSFIAFTTGKGKGLSEKEVLKFILATYTEGEQGVALLIEGKSTRQHEMMQSGEESKSMIQIAFDVQEEYVYKTQGELAAKLYRIFAKSYKEKHDNHDKEFKIFLNDEP